MPTSPSRYPLLAKLRWWALAPIVCAVSFYILVPHRTKVVESHAILQNGKKMDVAFTLQSSWGWSDPDRLTKMDVKLNGRSIPVDPSAYAGGIPVKSNQVPIIVEKAGFPEVIAIGKPGYTIKQANWSFMNYGLSERQVISTTGRDDSYYAPNPAQLPIGQTQVTQTLDLSGPATGGHIKRLGQ